MIDIICVLCRNYRPTVPNEGECHANPPTVAVFPMRDDGGQIVPMTFTAWPTIAADATGCGQFVPRPGA